MPELQWYSHLMYALEVPENLHRDRTYVLGLKLDSVCRAMLFYKGCGQDILLCTFILMVSSSSYSVMQFC